MSRFNNVPNYQITDADGNKHWMSPSTSADALLVVNGFTLIIKRSSSMSNPGLWCLPCGFMDFNETPLNTCIRELYEETGIDVRSLDILNSDYRRPYSLNGTALQFMFEVFERPEVHLNPAECDDYAWISVSMLNRYDFAFQHNRLIEYLLEQ